MHHTRLRRVSASLAVGLLLVSGVSAQTVRPAPRAPTPAPGLEVGIDWLGASIGAHVRDAAASELKAGGLSQPGAAVVTDVTPAGPAAKAGLEVGDLVAEFDGERVRGARHLGRLVRESPLARSATMVIVRQRGRRTLEVTPESRAAQVAPDLQRQVEQATRDVTRELSRLHERLDAEGQRRGEPFGGRRRLGVELMPLSGQLAEYFGVKEGVLVASVQADTPAASAGLKAGDVITAVNGRKVRARADVADALAQGGTALSLTVTRDRKETTLGATIPERDGPPMQTRSL